MAHQINLDALIPREDFDVDDTDGSTQPIATIGIRNLEESDFFYSVLKKPDFQRETSGWTAQKISDLVKSFLDGDLIPAPILWKAGGKIFVIDGAHRLSALIAWVHDDYGDGAISKQFFDGIIPEEQITAAQHARLLMKKNIGSYQDHRHAVKNPNSAKKEVIERAARLGQLAIQLQWVHGDSSKAQDSFFKINQKATPINKTELKLLESRRKPNALAARAIVRAGTGHKYWSSFEINKKQKIEEIAKDINEILFDPKLTTPIRTLDLPIAGKGYSAQTLPLVFDYVNLISNPKGQNVNDDIDGSETYEILKKCKKIVERISGNSAGSLGLHPAVYLYSFDGRYQQTAFLAVLTFIQYLEENNKIKEFIQVRERFENFLIKYKGIVNQVTVKYGSGMKGYSRLKDLFVFLMDNFLEDKNEDDIKTSMEISKEFKYIKLSEIPIGEEALNFTKKDKSAIFLRDALENSPRCGICGGKIHKNSISIDHIVRKSEGGRGSISNAQLAHPYCNSIYKN